MVKLRFPLTQEKRLDKYLKIALEYKDAQQ